MPDRSIPIIDAITDGLVMQLRISGMTQNDLAHDVGWSTATVSRFLSKSHRPRWEAEAIDWADKVSVIAAAIGLDLADLLSNPAAQQSRHRKEV